MEKSGKEEQRKNEFTQVTTFPVPFALGLINENITISTHSPSKLSIEKLINKAIQFHLKGNISEAAKNYQLFINQGLKDHRIFSNYGAILKDLGNLKEAEIFYRKAIEIKPYFAEAHSNLGIILSDLGKLQEAEVSLRKALEINPDLAEAHSNLGIILSELGNLEEAKNEWAKAIELAPNLTIAIEQLAMRLFYEKEYELAIKYLREVKSVIGQSLHLGCLLSLDKEKDFDHKYKELSRNRVCYAGIGGIVEHANCLYGTRKESHFCDKAINYIFVDKINEESFSEDDLNELISYINNDKIKMRFQGSLKGGVQTSGDLFTLNLPYIKSVKKTIEDKIEIYKNKFKDSGQGFINNWPEKYELKSWMIGMKSGGFLVPHNHEYGWITGSFYLQMPKCNGNDEAGNIAFSYQGPRYPNKDKNFNLTIKNIETRDICIFPSSLYHHTIPFESSEERICFVFDLVQKK
tara:strand:- start:7493 stop:8884 length:1392 start_codon:yes stop_codon:yes gene_type:complete